MRGKMEDLENNVGDTYKGTGKEYLSSPYGTNGKIGRTQPEEPCVHKAC